MNLSQRLKAEKILQIVCSEFEITEAELKAKCKKGRYVRSRGAAIMIMNANDISYRQAALLIGMAVASSYQISQKAKINHKQDKAYRTQVYKIITELHKNHTP